MKVEDYWLAQPNTCSGSGDPGHLEQIWQQTLSSEDNWVDEDLSVSKWEFLCWLTGRKGLLLHGSEVRPLARLRVVPEDFPFLRQVRGHDKKVIDERAAADPNGFPWLAP